MQRMIWVLILFWAALPAGPARAQALVADLTSHLVAITTGFTGTSVVLFGATDGTGDVIAVVRGPKRDTVVRYKSKVAGIWLNTEQTTFAAVPSFYSLASSRPLDDIAPLAARQLDQVGVENLQLGTIDPVPPDRQATFREALVRNKIRQGLFSTTVSPIVFLGNRLFRTTINFPANVPTGDYLVEVLLIRDQAVVAAQTIPLEISEIGFDADVYELADRLGLLYGLMAVLLAGAAGWLASLPFRNA